ncbi:MAG: hypothetical protein LC792_23575 [Actinobacteria bacterium]|nr:hypothetical protein [Actinomycetota bacterium]
MIDSGWGDLPITFEYSEARTPVGLLAKFRDRRDAQVAAAFFAERGIATRALPLAQPPSPAPAPTSRPLRRPLTYSAFGAFLLGLTVWLALFPEVLTAGWRLALTMLSGGSAAASMPMP